jgi:protein-L-isoaspartate(D-aspartate) O-methyltransferase
VGTGSGFLTACLASLAAHVTSIDIYDDFLEAAANKLESCGISNFELLEMDAMQELPAGSFDAIAVTGSLQSFDPRFVQALSPHGKLFVVVGDAPAMKAKLIERTNENDWQSISLFETTLAPLVNGALPPQFSF